LVINSVDQEIVVSQMKPMNDAVEVATYAPTDTALNELKLKYVMNKLINHNKICYYYINYS